MNVLDLSEYHEANLRLLADNGLRIPDDYEKFYMGHYRTESGCDFEQAIATPMKDGCGTSACMVGHAPFLGISLPQKGESWHNYGMRVFGLDSSSQNYDFMFGSYWAHCKGHETARACASRILFAIENDLSEEFQAEGTYGVQYPILDPLPENEYVGKLLENVQTSCPTALISELQTSS